MSVVVVVFLLFASLRRVEACEGDDRGEHSLAFCQMSCLVSHNVRYFRKSEGLENIDSPQMT